MIKDERGAVTAASAIFLAARCSPQIVEATALVHSQMLALDTGLSSLIIESYVKEVVEIVSSTSAPTSDLGLGLVILEVQDLMKKLQVMGCCFAHRSTNTVADGLSKFVVF
ncbi:hypothetical protein ACOSP7_032607 [Xanthoceras sorbifolium]